MADKSEAARRGRQADRHDARFTFEQVLQEELAAVTTRRALLDTERGEWADDDRAQDKAWKARLLGVSFSGGGIRSATFNLGCLQALASRGVLRYVDYLSTVSGGGYVGSWLTALSQRRFARTREDAQNADVDPGSLLELNPTGFKAFERALAWSAGDKLEADAPRTAPPAEQTKARNAESVPRGEDRAIRFLREFSNYLTPKLGLFSGDTWALISIYVRNALLNQLVLLLGLVAVLLMPRLLSRLLGRFDASELAGRTDTTEFIVWMLLAGVAHAFIAWNLGGNLAGITALRGGQANATRGVMWQIGFPLLLIGISAGAWLGYVASWPLPVAAAAGALATVYTWTLGRVSARWHARQTDRHARESRGRHTRESWGEAEKEFWGRMIWYSLPAGAVFGLLLHAVGNWLFGAEHYSGFKLVAAPPALALAVLLAGVLHVGLAGKTFSTQYTEWLSRFGGMVLIGTIGWLGYNGLVFFSPLLVAWLQGLWEAAVSSGWILTTLVSVVFGRSVAASSGRWSRLFMTVAPHIFIAGLGIAAAALLQAGLHRAAAAFGDETALERAKSAVYQRFEAVETDGLPGQIVGRLDSGATEAGTGLIADYGEWLERTEEQWLIVAAAIVLAAVLTWLVSLRVDVNVFSLNGMYANRLVRCYLGASVPDRKPNRFSGMSSRDDLQLKAEPRSIDGVDMLVHPLADGLAAGEEPGDPRRAVYPGPYHLINTAINLVAGGNLAYQERKAGAFLLSPLFCGFQLDSSSSEGPRGERIDAYRQTMAFSSQPRHLTLGEAVATSGAAASPNMGYHSTPAFAFLMGVFNIRLGRWVGNPHASNGNEKTWLKSGPKVALFHLLREVFGLTDKESGFVYLSDGGHFENLGIYELVRRRCRYIIACDAGADASYAFEDLGNAIRKCRTDLGVEIDIDVRHIGTIDALRHNAAPCAIGAIRYSEDEVGTILYVKASRRMGAPSDVLHYASHNPAFPHESTADQFFSESQFESYRRLGHFLGGEILGASRAAANEPLDVDRLFRDLSVRWYQPSTAIASSFGRLAAEADGLFERLRTSNELAFLSRQFYPEWRNLLGADVVDAELQTQDLLLVPEDERELRQAFYFCNSLIQLMENAYVALNLETEWQHPDNSGWLNVFNHWAWSGMFRVTWAVSAATYGGRFRAFCEQRLYLTLGDVNLEPALADENGVVSGLNGHEQRQVAELTAKYGPALRVYRLELLVRHPIVADTEPPLMKFGFGYAAMRGDELVMYRVQDHLRGMGLGRRGLVALKKRNGANFGRSFPPVGELLAFFKQFNEPTDRAKIADFRAMVVSVNEEPPQTKT